MVVYIDILLMENFIVNYFLLLITAKTLKFRVSIMRVLISSILGSMYIFTMLIKELRWLTMLPVKICIAFFMVLIMLNTTSFFYKVKGFIIFILYSMTLSGVCLFLSNSEVVSELSKTAIINFNYKELLLSLILLFLILNRIYNVIKDGICVEQLIYSIDVIYKDKIFSVKAFLDTGNELREPITHLPVIVIEESILDGIEISEKEKYYIKYKDVSGNLGKLLAFKPSYVVLHEKDKLKNKEFIIAITKTKLSAENAYNALLSRGAF